MEYEAQEKRLIDLRLNIPKNAKTSQKWLILIGGTGMNYSKQFYKDIPLRLIKRNYKNLKAKRFVINDTNQNLWIPNKHLEADGTIKQGENLDYIFRKSKRQLEIALEG